MLQEGTRLDDIHPKIRAKEGKNKSEYSLQTIFIILLGVSFR